MRIASNFNVGNSEKTWTGKKVAGKQAGDKKDQHKRASEPVRYTTPATIFIDIHYIWTALHASIPAVKNLFTHKKI